MPHAYVEKLSQALLEPPEVDFMDDGRGIV